MANNTTQLKSSTSLSEKIKSHSRWLFSESCELCGVVLNKKSELAIHLAEVHAEDIFHCEICDKLFKSKTLFETHVKLHEKCPQEVSESCSNSSGHGSDPNDDNYIPNEEQHSGMLRLKSFEELCTPRKIAKQNSLVCEVCGKHFKRLFHLKKHIKTHKTVVKVEEVHTEVGKSDAESCNEEENKEEGETTSAKKEKIKTTYRCDMCGKNFVLKDSFKSHQRIHTGEKPFTCHICGKQFSHTGGLYYHLKHVHAGIKNHSCDICGRSFALKAAMEDHRRIHTGERPYVCHTCGKSFKTKASLYIHSKIHTDSFPHPCTYCQRRFRWRQQLLAHLTTHTGEKPHKCDVCGKGFGVKNDLTRHKLIHSDAKPFVCPLCGLCFGQKRYLKNHEKLRHGTQR